MGYRSSLNFVDLLLIETQQIMPQRGERGDACHYNDIQLNLNWLIFSLVRCNQYKFRNTNDIFQITSTDFDNEGAFYL